MRMAEGDKRKEPPTFADLLEFFDAPTAGSFDLVPEQALAFFRAKGMRTTFSWQDMMGQEHAAAFTVAKMMDTDMLEDVRASLDDALARGVPFGEWSQSITPLLQAKGWWGRQPLVDPLTGQTVVAQLGSPGRLKTIFRTNMQSAYSVGAWERIAEQAQDAPFLMYDAVDDHRTRDEHRAWDNKVLPVDSPFWRTHYPPNGWNCRCGVIQLSQDDLEEFALSVDEIPDQGTYKWTNPRTGKTSRVPVGVDPSFDFNPGMSRLEHLAKLAAEKVQAMADAAAAQAAAEGLLAAEKAASAMTDAQLAMVKAQGQYNLARAQMKAAERSALWQINEALEKKTPNLAKAIKDLQATKAGKAMGPVQLLETAKAQAAKIKAQSALSDWKKAYLADKKPGPAAQAQFDALPQDAQDALLAQLDAQKAAILAEKAAQAELASLAAGDMGKLEAQLLKKLEGTDAYQGATTTGKVQMVKDAATAEKLKISQATTLAGLKKSLIAGKQPSPAQAKLLAEMPQDQVDSLMAQVAKAQADAQPTPPPPGNPLPNPAATLNPDDLVQVGGQGGSNPGGVFIDQSTGQKWYLKWPDAGEDVVRNEVLAGQLYQLAGVESATLRFLTYKGRPTIASKWVDGLEIDANALTRGDPPGVRDHFAVDAWLANWDVVGLGYDNLKLLDGRAVRVDPGGALRYRAQGGLKGQAFGDDVPELESLRNAGRNAQAAATFRNVTDQDIERGIARIMSIPEQSIKDLVESQGPRNPAERAQLLARLLARRQWMAEKYPGWRRFAVQEDAPPVERPRVSELDQREIAAARINGYSILTDKGDIESQNVVVMVYKDRDGNPKTRLQFKLLQRAADQLERQVTGGQRVDFEVSTLGLRQAMEAFVRGVNKQAREGGIYRPDKDVQRLQELEQQLVAFQHAMTKAREFGTDSQAWREVVRLHDMANDVLRAADRLVPGQPAYNLGMFEWGGFEDRLGFKRAGAGEEQALSFQRRSGFEYGLGRIERGFMRETGDTYNVGSKVNISELRGNVDGALVRFVPASSDNPLAMRGYVQIDLDGAGLDVTNKAMATVARLVKDSAPPTAEDRLELYLFAQLDHYTPRNNSLRQALDLVRLEQDQQKRINVLTTTLNDLVGEDVTSSPHFRPDGAAQAFGHGRRLQYRADVTAYERRMVEDNVLLWHNVDNLGWSADDRVVEEKILNLIDWGGQMASLVDRVRRGVTMAGTSSASSDLQTGGGAYVFTRVADRRNLKYVEQNSAGIWFKGANALRVDAKSFDSDVFGNVETYTQDAHRHGDVAGIIKHAENRGNETNLRDTTDLLDAVQVITFRNQTTVERFVASLRQRGYATWPDGRTLDEVVMTTNRFMKVYGRD